MSLLAGPAGPHLFDVQLRRQALPPPPAAASTPRQSSGHWTHPPPPDLTPRGTDSPAPASGDVPADALFLPDGGILAAAAAERQLGGVAAAAGGAWDVGFRTATPRAGAFSPAARGCVFASERGQEIVGGQGQVPPPPRLHTVTRP